MDRHSENLDPNQFRAAACPDPLSWYEIASGTIDAETAERHIRHATDCAHCGHLLKDAIVDLNDESTAEEAQAITALQSAQPEWQQRLAQRMAGSVAPEIKSKESKWTRWWTAPRAVLAAVSILALVIAGYRYQSQNNQQQAVDRLLAQAASVRRISPLRMAGARFAQLGEGLDREPSSTFLSAPGELLKAQALIYDQLAAHPSDPFWLQAKARADLLNGKYDAAQLTLTRALQLSPKSPGILIDLASANFHQQNYAAAYENLSLALSMKPEDPIALFNRALTSEKQFLYHQALADWEHYLQVDPNSEWSEEARRRADAVRAEMEKLNQGRSAPLLTPIELAAAWSQPERRVQVDERIGEYLDSAVVEWLPEAYPAPAAAGNPVAEQALFFLADLTGRQHGDSWLTDLLRGAHGPRFASAVAALAKSARANNVGEFDVARREALRSEELFHASANTAGSLRAQFEQAFSAQLLRDAVNCRETAGRALTESERYPYHWLHIQLGLEKSVCLGLSGDMGGDQQAAHLAMERARLSGYTGLFLRAIGFAADDQVEAGDPFAARNLTQAGLQRYWSGPFPAMRGFNLYAELGTIAETAGQHHLELAAFQEGVALIDSDPDLSSRAVAHARLAEAGVAAHQPKTAEQHFAEAARLYARAPQTARVRNSRIENEIRRAQIEARQKEFDAALTRLTGVQDQVQSSSDQYLGLKFYATLGEVELQRGLAAQAEQSLRAALDYSETALASLKSQSDWVNWSPDAARVYLALAEAELAQGREQDSLEMYEWYLNAPQRAGKPRANLRLGYTGAHALSPTSALNSRLPLLADATVLAYGVLPGGLAIWEYDDRGVHAQWFPGALDELEELSSRFGELTSNPRSEMNAVRRDAQDLYRRLVAPMEDLLIPHRVLVIETNGWLTQLPFEALLGSDGHYLEERAPIVHSPGPNFGLASQPEVAISPSLPALIVGSTASSQSEGLIQLPDVTAEADAVAASFRSAKVLKGPEATLANVKKFLHGAAIFHFAGHSLFTPEKSGLMLVEGNANPERTLLLDANALRAINLKNLQLAVLSACDTASGNGGHRGFNAVTEVLLRVGVPHVVASRWPVDSARTRGLIEDYYQNLLSGNSVSQSMRLTARKILSDPRTSHPFYWSAFAAFGRP